jgi:hypothetical protein
MTHRTAIVKWYTEKCKSGSTDGHLAGCRP